MLKNDEDKTSWSCRTKGHIEIEMHLGRGTHCCSTLSPCCRQFVRVSNKNLKGVSLGWVMRQIKSKVGETQRDEI